MGALVLLDFRVYFESIHSRIKRVNKSITEQKQKIKTLEKIKTTLTSLKPLVVDVTSIKFSVHPKLI